MSDIVLTPVVSVSTRQELTMEFKVQCNDVTVLIDIKKEFASFLRRKDYNVDILHGWHETNG